MPPLFLCMGPPHGWHDALGRRLWFLAEGGFSPLVAAPPAVGPGRGWAPTSRRWPRVPGVGGPPSAVAGRGPPLLPGVAGRVVFFVTLGAVSPQEFGKRVLVMSFSGMSAPSRFIAESQFWPPGFLFALSSVGVVRASCHSCGDAEEWETMVSNFPLRYWYRDLVSGWEARALLLLPCSGGAGRPPGCSSCTQIFVW